MKLTNEAKKGAKLLFKASLSSGRLDPVKAGEVLARLRDSRNSHVWGLIQEYARLVRLEVERNTARIQSAVPLSGDLRVGISSALAKSFGADVVAEYSVSEELIAGVRIRMGSQVYENSVKDRLSRLQADIGR